VWPPYKVPKGTKPTGAKGVGALGVSDEGALTVGGLEAYRYSGDSKKGQASGEGIQSFGGIWHAVTAAAAASGTK
jgi:hypothetical protein